jgi:uncharacterized protein (TIGR04222 family)
VTGPVPAAVPPGVPAAVPPGVLGALVGCSRLEMATATLLDLAHRGHLEVTRTDDTWWRLTARDGDDEPRRAERVLLDVLGVARGPVRYPCLTRADVDRVHDALVSDAARLGLAGPDPVRRRRVGLAVAAVVVVLAVLGAVVAGAVSGSPLLASGLVVLAVLAPPVALRRPRVHATDGGRAAVAAARDVERRLVAGGSDLSPADLPAMVALGRLQGFTRVLDRRNEPAPPWLHGAGWLDLQPFATAVDPSRPTHASS